MGVKLTEFVVDCADPEALAAFWCAVLGWEVIDRDDDGSVEIGDGSLPTLLFEPVPEAKVVKNRIHIDVRPTEDQQAEVGRIIGLGATLIDIGQGDVSWVVLADPEGNEFCVLRGTA
jgi:catechol 2,3-dioxygenase-like lactoylglutathione lyase family enzyme